MPYQTSNQSSISSFYPAVLACITQDIEALNKYNSYSWLNLNNVYDSEGDPLLLVAIKYDKPLSFDTLIALGLDIEKPALIDGATALNFAAMIGAMDYVEKLVEMGGNVNTQDFYGFTPLCNAIYMDNAFVVEYLLTLPEVDVNIPCLDMTPFEIAYYTKQWDMVDNIMAHPQFDATFTYIFLKQFVNVDDYLNYLETHSNEIDYEFVAMCEQAKLFGLKFDILGNFMPSEFDNHGELNFSFEGYSNELGIQMIAQSYDAYYNLVMNSSGIPDWAIKAFSVVHESIDFSQNVTSPQAYLNKWIAGEPIIIPVSVDLDWTEDGAGHAIAFVIHDDHLYRCNRGYESDGVHGIDEFVITQPWNLTPELIDFIMMGQGDENFYFQNGIIDALGLKLIGQVENPTQITGNCVWTSLETGVEALFITAYLDAGLDSETAHELAKQTFLTWEKYDLDTSLNEIIQHPDLLIQNEIYDDLLINIIESHHNPDDLDDVQRGCLILEQLSEPTVFASFDEKIGQFVMEYDSSSYKKISYMESYTPSYYDYFMSFIFSPEKTLTPYGLEIAKEYFDFLVACDEFQASTSDLKIGYDDVIDLSLHQLFSDIITDTPVVESNTTAPYSSLDWTPVAPLPLIVSHHVEETVYL